MAEPTNEDVSSDLLATEEIVSEDEDETAALADLARAIAQFRDVPPEDLAPEDLAETDFENEIPPFRCIRPLSPMSKKRGPSTPPLPYPGPSSATFPYPGPSSAPPAYPGTSSAPPAYPGTSSATPAYPGPSSAPPAYPGTSSATPAYPGPSSATPAYPGTSSASPAYPGSFSATLAYPGTSSDTLAYPGTSSASPAYPGPSSATLAYPGTSSDTLAYPGTSSASPAYPGPSSATLAYPGTSSDTLAYPGTSSDTPAYPGPSSAPPAYPGPSGTAPTYSTPDGPIQGLKFKLQYKLDLGLQKDTVGASVSRPNHDSLNVIGYYTSGKLFEKTLTLPSRIDPESLLCSYSPDDGLLTVFCLEEDPTITQKDEVLKLIKKSYKRINELKEICESMLRGTQVYTGAGLRTIQLPAPARSVVQLSLMLSISLVLRSLRAFRKVYARHLQERQQ